MSNRVRLELGSLWHRSGTTWVRGHATAAGRPLQGHELATWLDRLPLAARIGDIDGGFSAIQERDGTIVAAVDRLRSVPLFYAVDHGTLLLSDDAHWIREQLEPRPFEAVSRGEFLALGYVTGDRTLDSRIRQLRGGRALGGTDRRRGWPPAETLLDIRASRDAIHRRRWGVAYAMGCTAQPDHDAPRRIR